MAPQVVSQISFDRGRSYPAFQTNASAGADIHKSERLNVRLQVDGQNLSNVLDVIDFGRLFSNNAIRPSRSFAGVSEPLSNAARFLPTRTFARCDESKLIGRAKLRANRGLLSSPASRRANFLTDPADQYSVRVYDQRRRASGEEQDP